jgi:15-cis-phytoene synthase
MQTTPDMALLTSEKWLSASRQAEDLIRANSKTFYFATALLPARARSAIRALYGFCRKTDDLVDRQDATDQDLEVWRKQLQLRIEDQDDPVLYCWSVTRQIYGIDRLYEQELIDGMAMDLAHTTYPTWHALEFYCYHVASTVGLLSMAITGLVPGARFETAMSYAIDLGIALQLTNILRDVGEDLQRGRIYLPEEDLQRFDLSPGDIHRQVVDERFINLMKFEITRARQYFQKSLPGITLLSASSRPAVGAAALLYQAILDEIEHNHYDVFRIRAHTSGWRKLSMLPGILLRVFTLKQVKC